MAHVSYTVKFPGPVGKHDNVPDTVIVIDGSWSTAQLEARIGVQLCKYLRSIGVSSSRALSCYPAMSTPDDGAGTIFAGPDTPRQVRIGRFTVERLNGAQAA